jgi:hypothetical protein
MSMFVWLLFLTADTKGLRVVLSVSVTGVTAALLLCLLQRLF